MFSWHSFCLGPKAKRMSAKQYQAMEATKQISTRIAISKMNFQKTKSALTNKYISINTTKSPEDLYWTHLDEWKETGGNRNVVPTENCYQMKQCVLHEADTTRSLINRIHLWKQEATFSCHVIRRKQLEHHVTTGSIAK